MRVMVTSSCIVEEATVRQRVPYTPPGHDDRNLRMPSVTRKSQSSRAERRDEIRRRLLAVVENLLDKGENFTEVSVERLVSEAGISRSTFYVYFEDKGDLLLGWFNDITAELANAAGAWWSSGPDSTHRSEEHTSELQSLTNLVCRLLLEKKKNSRRRRCRKTRKTNAIR